MKQIILVFTFLFSLQLLHAQSTVTGTILNDNGQPVKGATVTVNDSKEDIKTDENGQFVLELKDASSSKILVEYRGHQKVEHSIASSDNDLVIELAPKSKPLQLVDFILKIDEYLEDFLKSYGTLVYVILFMIIFIETGVVIMPFLPGDSLLFAAGMMAAQFPNELSVTLLIIVMLIAAILGDTLNYTIGKEFGHQALKVKIFGKTFVKEQHINETHKFYEKHGSKTIVLARFVPIVRTLAPFVAGIGRMSYKTFAFYNVVGAILWVVGITLVGYLLGNIPLVRDNFEKVVLGIIFVSVLPIIFGYIKEKRSVA